MRPLLVASPRARCGSRLRRDSPAPRLLLALVGWWWGEPRLDTLDRSPLSAEVGRAGRALVVVDGQPRVGRFDQRATGPRPSPSPGDAIDERVQLELPLGRAPPQGALIDVLAVVRLPRGRQGGFDERTWLRRQGIHVVFRVDEWSATGRRRGGLAGAGDRLRTWSRGASRPGWRENGARSSKGSCSGTTTGSRRSSSGVPAAGLYHLLAVSGAERRAVAGGMLVLAWAPRLPRWWATSRRSPRSARTCSPSARSRR